MSEQTSKRNDSPMMNARPGGPRNRMGMPGEKAKNSKKALKRIIKYISSGKKLLITIIAVILIVTGLSVFAPTLQAKAIDTLKLDENLTNVDFERFYTLLACMLGIYIILSVMTYIQSVCAARLSQTTVRKLRGDLFKHISHLSIKYVDNHPHGDIMSRMTNDIENISNTVSTSLASIISGIVTIIGTLCIMLWYSPLLTCVSMVSVVLTLLSSAFLTKYMRRYFPRQQVLIGQINSQVEEIVTGYTTVIAYQKERASRDKFNGINNELKKTGILAQIFGGIMGPFMNVIGNFGFLLVAVVGGHLAVNGSISIGVISAFIIYTRQFTRPINEIAQQYAQIQTALAGAERVFEIMDEKPEEDNGSLVDFKPETAEGALSFENIRFSYVEGEPVLKDFDLDVKSGEQIAIVGATGSGKTTVVNLLTRFYDIDGGRITLDGIDIFDIPKQKLRKTIGIVLQDSVVFSDTIANNIRYGKPEATDEEVEAAAKAALVDKFVKHLDKGYNTVLSEGGSNISQGQRQLICIARAVLNNPKLLILDEATSNIDTRTEMHIQKAMLTLVENRTSLIIAHRLSTIRDSDKIIVLAGGRIVEMGNHDELIAKGGEYYTLYQNQFAGIKT